MSIPLGALSKMVEFGLTAEQILAVAEEMENGVRHRSANAERQARFRAKRAKSVTESVTSNVTDNAESNDSSLPDKEVSPTPPSRKLTLVTPPIVPPVGGDASSNDKTEVEAARTVVIGRIDRVWQAMSAAARRRSSRADIEAALKAAQRRGRDPEQVVAALEVYYRTPDATKDDGQFAKGAHRMIANDRWQAFVEAAKPQQTAEQVAEDRNAWWGRRVSEYAKSRHWNEVDWGPRPGREGCHVPTQILETHGFSERKAV